MKHCRNFLCLFTVLALVLSFHVRAAGRVTYATSYEDLYNALEVAADGDTVFLMADMRIPQPLEITANVTVSAMSGCPVTLTKGSRAMFHVTSGSLTLAGELTLQGCASTQSIVVCEMGTALTVNSGVVLQDNIVSGKAMGGAVTLFDAVFTMNGGKILSCGVLRSENPSADYGGGAMGGAVRLRTSAGSGSGAKFIMRGGTISSCSAKNGGAIGGENLGSDAGVQVIVSGGSICYCSADCGSAIFLYNRSGISNAQAALYGGSIYGCTGQYGVVHAYQKGQQYGSQILLSGTKIRDNDDCGVYLGDLDDCLTLGGNTVLEDPIYLAGSGRFTVSRDFTGKACVYLPNPTNNTFLATAEGSPTGSVLLLDGNGNVHPSLSVVRAGDRYELREVSTEPTVPTVPPESSHPTQPTEPSESTTPPTVPTTAPTVPTTEPTVPTTVPTKPTTPPTVPTTAPTVPTTVPTVTTTVPTKPTTTPTVPTTAPTVPTTVPTVPTTAPTVPTTTPTVPTTAPTSPTLATTVPTIVPTSPTMATTVPTAATAPTQTETTDVWVSTEEASPSAPSPTAEPATETVPSASSAVEDLAPSRESPLPWFLVLGLALTLLLVLFLRRFFRW